MSDVTIYTLSQLEEIFPFGKSKLLALCKAGVLPVVKVGRDYISSPDDNTMDVRTRRKGSFVLNQFNYMVQYYQTFFILLCLGDLYATDKYKS